MKPSRRRQHLNATSVLAVHPGAEMYGSDRVFLSSVRALAEDHDVRVLVPHHGALVESLRETPRASVTVKSFAVLRRVDFKGLGLIRTLVRTTADLVAACRLIRRSRPDVVYVSTIIAPLWIVAAAVCRVPVAVHAHENEPGLSPVKSRLLLAPLLLSTVVIANSRATQDWLSRVFPRLGARISLLYNGVTVPQSNPALRQLSSQEGPVRLILVGRLAERKGQDIAVQALRYLRSSGVDAKLTLVGDVYPGYEAYAASLRDLALQLQVDDAVAYAGFVADPSIFFMEADVVLVPSRVEPFGNVAVEAQLHRRCVVASDVQGLAEIVQHGETGLLVTPGDPLALADAITRVVREPALADRLATGGRERAVRLFAEDRYADELRRLFSDLLAARRPRARSTTA